VTDFKRKIIRLSGFDYRSKQDVYFITINTFEKQRYFINDRLVEKLKNSIDFRVNEGEVKMFCYCIMSNHVHMLFSLSKSYSKSLSVWISSFKSHTAKFAKGIFGIDKLWQVNYYDHIVRSDESLSKIADYILHNPVRKGIVQKWEDYPHSKLYIWDD